MRDDACIAASGHEVPPAGWTKIKNASGKTIQFYPSPSGGVFDRAAHKARIILFGEVADRVDPYFRIYSQLSRFLTIEARNDALYYKASVDQLPYELYPASFPTGLLPVVEQFVHQVWKSIK